ncbi:MAG TPA: hypothetical protein VIN08_05485 [Ohtaekwangia sp.]|uniref:hypothetical protein n=1 Tax=Ohtaekwangia sp. TaxID=2066019 RepID=UPI002F93D489
MLRLTQILIVGMILFAQITTQAQNIFNSPYSVYGVGMINNRTSSLNRAMGGVGIGVQDDYNLNPVNPASYGAISTPITHIYEIGLYVESNRYRSNQSTDSKSTGGINNINYWFKFSKWWSASVGLAPYSSVGYKINTARDLGASSNVNYTYSGSGNLNQLYLGNAFNVVKNLSLGVNIAYVFGSTTKSESIDLSTQSLTYQNQVVAHKADVDFGAQYRFNFKKRALVVGVVYDDGITFHGKQKSSLYDSNADTLTSATGKKLTYKLPMSAGIGVGLHSRLSVLAADLRYTKWTSANFSDQELVFQDTWKLSAGYLYKGNPNAESYFGLASLRAGFYVQQYQLKLDGTSFPSWGLSGGVSLPVFDGKSAVNLTYSYDRLGTTTNGLILQNSQKIMIDVVIRDLWGIKRKFD